MFEGGYRHFIRNIKDYRAVAIVAKKITINLFEGIDEGSLAMEVNRVLIWIFWLPAQALK
ncbi:MAG: hypothetical protein ACNYPI_09365 [Arenicellales bacterium WSBS_2016_MAG_OTU3]